MTGFVLPAAIGALFAMALYASASTLRSEYRDGGRGGAREVATLYVSAAVCASVSVAVLLSGLRFPGLYHQPSVALLILGTIFAAAAFVYTTAGMDALPESSTGYRQRLRKAVIVKVGLVMCSFALYLCSAVV